MTAVTPVTAVTLVETPSVLANYATPTGLDLPDNLDFEEWSVVGCLLAHIESGVMWWIGDWWRYGERAYGDAARAAAPTGYSAEACRAAAWVADRIESVSRETDLTWSHHRAVAALEPQERNELLSVAKSEGWSVADITAEVRRRKTARRIGQAAGEAPALAAKGLYQVLYVDPPWRYEDAEPSRAVENNYPTMSLDEICALKDDLPAAGDSVLFMWATSPKLEESLAVVNAWDFTYRTCMAWVKDKIGMGYYARQQHELLLIAKRGELPIPAPETRPSSVLAAPRTTHSTKPTEFYELIERMYPQLSKVELFARNERQGWERWGNQVEMTA